jgi:hypothetical protein
MSSRSIRRAAERKSLKDARKTVLPTDASEQIPSARPVSEARLAANAANARLSTGPSTPAGKAKSSVNAVTTALTGRTVLLPSDDGAAYRQHLQDFADEFHPVGPREAELVQAIADHAWRLIRISNLEMAFFASGHEQFAEQFADRGDMQASFTQMHTFLHYEKQLRNLQIQEARLRRNREKDTAELRRLQQDRLEKEQATADAESETARAACENGFDFAFTTEYAEVDAIQHFEPSPLSNSELPELASRPRIAA